MSISKIQLESIGFEPYDGLNLDKNTVYKKHNVIVGNKNGLQRVFIVSDFTMLKQHTCEATNVNTIERLQMLCDIIKPDKSSLKS